MSNTVKSIQHSYSYDNLYRLTEANGTIQENGNTVNSYSNEFAYSSIGNIMKKLQTVKVKGADDPALTYNYTYKYAGNKPHAVTGINDNLTYRYDANGNMTAVYDTAKNYNRVLWWDDDNRLTKTVDTTAGSSVATTYAYDAKGKRIIKDGPYGKSIYVDTGYVLSQEYVESNHVFVGNTRIASVVKHKDESQAATYYYATDHLGSSSVLTSNTGAYHERIEYLPYGEVWLEDAANSSGYSTPYKFTGKELDKETGLYYFGARYYDARISRWISADPALEKYLPDKDKLKINDNDLKHKGLFDKVYKDYPNMDFEKYKEIEGMGGVYNPVNIDMYQYAWQNPITHYDPDGEKVLMIFVGAGGGFGMSFEGSAGYLVQYGKGVEFKIYRVVASNKAAGREMMFGLLLTAYPTNIKTVDDLKKAKFVNFLTRLGGGLFGPIFGIGISNINNELSISVTGGQGFVRGVSFSIPEEYSKNNEPQELDLNSKEAKFINDMFKIFFPFEKTK